MSTPSAVGVLIDDSNLGRIDAVGGVIAAQQECVRIIRTSQQQIQTARAVLAALRTIDAGLLEVERANYRLRGLNVRVNPSRERAVA